jgi:hypothetical protein
MHLDNFYDLLCERAEIECNDDSLIEIGIMQQGLGLKMYGKEEPITLYFYPNHPTSEVSVMRNGMRYIYPRRQIRMRKHTIIDLINIIRKDERLFGCGQMIQWHLNDIVKQDYVRCMASERLS